MPRDSSVLFVDMIDKLIDRLAEGIYDAVSSVDRGSKTEFLVKLSKLHLMMEMMTDLLPEDFDRKNFEPISRHLHFVDYYYTKDKDFAMLKSNADDLLKEDLPALRRNLKLFFEQDTVKQLKTIQRPIEGGVDQVIVDVRSNLRRLVREKPENERKIQDHLEDLLALKSYRFEREQVSIPYSTKSYVPDFASEKLNLAIDVKLCNSSSDEKKIIDEINADIPAYKQKYQYLLFVVYDVAVIRKIQEYVLDIEKSNPNVTVVVIKH